MRRLRTLVASIGVSLALAGVLAMPAGAYGGGADHDITFFASGEQTTAGHGTKVTTDFVNMDTGIPAQPSHYDTADVFGFTAPGVAVEIQVAFCPAKQGSSARSRSRAFARAAS